MNLDVCIYEKINKIDVFESKEHLGYTLGLCKVMMYDVIGVSFSLIAGFLRDSVAHQIFGEVEMYVLFSVMIIDCAAQVI